MHETVSTRFIVHGLRIPGHEVKRPVEGFEPFLIATKAHQGCTQDRVDLGSMRRKVLGPADCLQPFVHSLQIQQRGSTVKMCLGELGLPDQRPLVDRHSL
jgi:hypothetical protein